jgi:hypothetical protein
MVSKKRNGEAKKKQKMIDGKCSLQPETGV